MAKQTNASFNSEWAYFTDAATTRQRAREDTFTPSEDMRTPKINAGVTGTSLCLPG